MRAPKSIKTKIIFLYFILFSAAIFSGAYIYKEAKKFTIPEEQILEENNKVFLVTSTINNIYSSESQSRSAILSGNQDEIKLYYKELDTIVSQIGSIKQAVDDPIISIKLDSVIDLLSRKKISFKNIVSARLELKSDSEYTEAFSKIYNIREEIEKNLKPIIIQSEEKEKRSGWARLFKGDNTDTIKTTINYPNISDSLINAMENIILTTQEKINDKQSYLFLQEERLQKENKIITEQLKDILQNIEQNILALSYQKINESKSRVSIASTNIAYIGGSALLAVLVLGWIIIRDINQTQLYRSALEKLNAENELLLRSKTMLLATVTHDLQTPLGGVIGFTELLSQTALDEKQQKYVNNISSSSQYIANLVNDLTDFSKLENDKINIQEKVFNPKTLVENTCNTLIHKADNKNITLEWDIDSELDMNFISDPYRINQILNNLLINAIKFTQEGGVSVKVKKNKSTIVFEVTDSGIGIAQEQTLNIFNEFQQAHDGIEKKYGGTGLGLNISKRIVELLGGNISVESSLNQGSVFTFSIPVKDATQSATTVTPIIDFTTIFKPLNKINIIVIDDDKVQLQLMEEILSPIFNTVTLTHDPSNINTLLDKKHYDLILTDIQMPKMDGFELINYLKASRFKDIPVIALSGKRDISIQEFKQAGFHSAHTKPLQLDELLLLIASTLNITIDTTITTYKKPMKNMSEFNTTSPAYNLDTLKQFMGEDTNALNNLLVKFIESTEENLLDLRYALEDKDFKLINNIAHKMLPMFRQLAMHLIIPTLELLEQKNHEEEDLEKITLQILHIEELTKDVLNQIKTDNLI